MANKLQTGTIIRRLQAEKKNSIMANFSNKENKKMDIFEETKNKLDIVEVAEYYGIELNKQNKCCCPFHTEKTGSFQVYPKTQSFYCFGCGVGGDTIAFVQKFLNLPSPIKAAERLNNDFNLGLNMKPHKQTRAETAENERRQRKKVLISSWDSWKNKALKQLISRERFYKQAQKRFAPKHPNDEFNPIFVKACQSLEYLSFLIDELMAVDEIEREKTWQEFFLNNGEEFLKNG